MTAANVEGVFFDEPAETYHADAEHAIPSLSGSLAKILIDATPRHCWWNSPRLNPKFRPEYKSIWDRGSAVHALLLNSGAEVARIDADNYKTAKARALRDAARAAGQIPILEADYAEIMEALGAVVPQLDRLDGGDPFKMGKPEVVIRWRDDFIAADGRALSVWCRARLDWLALDSENAVDLKSMTGSANPREWCKWRIWDIGAPYQAAFYRRGMRRLAQIGKLRAFDPDFNFLLVESKGPYAISLVNVPSDIRQRRGEKTADEKIVEAMTTWHDCLESGVWPGWSGDIHIAEGAKEAPQPQWTNGQPFNGGGHLDSEAIAREL